MKLTGEKTLNTATSCPRCNGTGMEPGTLLREQRICSVCLGVQYVDKDTGAAFDDFNSVRVMIRLMWRKDFQIKKRDEEIHRLQKVMAELKPYMDKKAADDLCKSVYPKDRTLKGATYVGD